MNGEPVSLEVYILDKAYRIACSPGEEEDLLASARLLSDHMREVKSVNKVMSHDRMAIMAGLNLAHELIASRRNGSDDMAERLALLGDRVAAALNNSTESEV